MILLPPTAENDAVFPGGSSAGGGGGGRGSARLGGGPRGAAAEGDAGVTKSGISRGVSCGRGGRVGELGGVVLFVVLGFGVAVAVGPKVRGKV